MGGEARNGGGRTSSRLVAMTEMLARADSNTMEPKDPLEDELGKYEGQWVAIQEETRQVVGSGETARQAKSEAEAKGYQETALFKVRHSGKIYVY